MTNAYFSLLKVDVPYLIVYVNHFGLSGKTVSLICGLCLCAMGILYICSTPLPYMVCSDPEIGTDHSLKEVSAYIIWNRVHTWGLQGKCHESFSEHFCLYLQIIYANVKNSSAEGTC